MFYYIISSFSNNPNFVIYVYFQNKNNYTSVNGVHYHQSAVYSSYSLPVQKHSRALLSSFLNSQYNLSCETRVPQKTQSIQ